jgi:hypothetical protein
MSFVEGIKMSSSGCLLDAAAALPDVPAALFALVALGMLGA